eukprot:m.207929 g.207929  ORF g.207929 m.207929 type:complete len:634 (-) comp23980_c0_seq1:64-1965(-)
MASKAEALAHRILKSKGRGSSRSTVDYDALRGRVAKQKRASTVSATKVNALRAEEKRTAEQQVRQLHRVVWQGELTRLETERLRAEHTLEESVRLLDAMGVRESRNDATLSNGSGYIDGPAEVTEESLTESLENYQERIFEYEAAVQHKVLTAVRAARQAAAGSSKGSSDTDVLPARDALSELKRLSDLFASEMTKLNARAARLDAETATVVAAGGDSTSATMMRGDAWAAGRWDCAVPALSECPDEELQLSIRAEANEVEQGIAERFRILDTTYRAVLAGGPTCGWSRQDHAWYIKVEQEYTNSRAEEACKEANTTLRQLMLDRMLMERPGLTRAALLDHEAAVAAQRFYDKQLRHVARMADAERAQFQEHAAAALAQARALATKRDSAEAQQAELDRVRLQLKERLLRWKRDKLEATRADERQRLAEAHSTAEWEAQEAARIASERRVLKEKLQLHREERERADALAHEHENRLAVLRAAQAAEQAEFNAKRVDFRREQQRHRDAEAALQRQLEEERAIERERRLERLRAQVEVSATIDPERTRGPTVASQAAVAAAVAHRDDIAARRRETRSFETHGYTRDHLDRDQRMRVEAALRAQGLAHTDYAREIMRTLPPPTVPRRGLESSLFKE